MIKKKRTLLVIEDNEINRDIVQEILSEDYSLYLAENGEQGLQLLREHIAEIALVLLDIQMPVMNGYEVLEAVSKDSVLRQVPIIVTTSNDGIDEEERCLELGASDFVKKPYNPHVLRLRVESIIRLQESTAMLTEVEIDKHTGAYTYNAFMHYAQEWLDQNPEVDFTLAISDIIGFKAIHAQLGNQAFNLLKQEIELTQSMLQGQVLIGHYSIDRLLFFYPTLSVDLTGTDKETFYEKYLIELSTQNKIAFKAGFCEHVDRSQTLQSHLDLVKVALENIVGQYNRYAAFVGPELLDKLQRKHRIEADMVKAITLRQMQVYYQPKHDAQTKQLVGAEALIRWFHPELGSISPVEFIPIFEQNGFISQVDAFVWRETCKNQHLWLEKGLKVVPISVNASRLDLLVPNLDAIISGMMKEHQVPVDLMHIEVTEGFFANLTSSAIESIKKVRDLGIMVELDDFGTGYSSLHSLAELPIDIVKFDMGFVRKLGDPREQMLMKGCIDLVKRFDLMSIAEGVETEENCQIVAQMGIDTIQGYYYSKPLPESLFEEYLIAEENKNIGTPD